MTQSRRNFLKTSAAMAAAMSLRGFAPSVLAANAPTTKPTATADAFVLIYLPGGCAQRDLWDVKKHTPYEKGMKGSELFSTCPAIATSADNIQLGAGLENLAKQMHHATVLRTLTNETKFGAIHLK